MNSTWDVVDIYFSDLKPEAQKEVLDAFGLKNEKEANWDVFPLASIEVEEDEEE